MDIYSLSEKELRKYVTREVKMANQRIRRLESSGEQDKSRAYKYAMRTGGKFSTRGKDKRGLLKELHRVEEYNARPDSNLRGTRAEERRRKQQFHENLVDKKADISKKDWAVFDETYNKLLDYVENSRGYLTKQERYALYQHTVEKIHEGGYTDPDKFMEDFSKFAIDFVDSMREENSIEGIFYGI